MSGQIQTFFVSSSNYREWSTDHGESHRDWLLCILPIRSVSILMNWMLAHYLCKNIKDCYCMTFAHSSWVTFAWRTDGDGLFDSRRELGGAVWRLCVCLWRGRWLGDSIFGVQWLKSMWKSLAKNNEKQCWSRYEWKSWFLARKQQCRKCPWSLKVPDRLTRDCQ